MPVVTQCTAPDCETLTMGPLCIEHDQPRARVLVRGRPAAHFVVDTGASWTTPAPRGGIARPEQKPRGAALIRR